MARLTYLGEGLWPSPQIEWDDEIFPRGQAVEVDDPAKVKKASANPAFRVELEKAPPPDPEPIPEHDDDDDEAPPHRTGFRRHAPTKRK